VTLWIEIICATNPSPEGELLFRDCYHFVNAKAPVRRLWISSLTKESIQKGYLLHISKYSVLYDWHDSFHWCLGCFDFSDSNINFCTLIKNSIHFMHQLSVDVLQTG
jgi:hypothetical protein